MRISSNMIYQAGSSKLSDLQSALQRSQQMLSSGRRILTPSDDPVAASQALEITQAQAANAQFAANRQMANGVLGQVDVTLASVTDLLTQSRTLLVSAGNTATMSDSDRATVATQLSENLDQLLALANANDGKGNYLFAGYQTSTQPFTRTAAGAQYNGDQGEQSLQIGPSRQIPLSSPGDAVFNAIKAVTTAAGGANVGSGAISAGIVTGAAALTGHAYSINFTGTGTTYDIVDSTTGTAVSTGNTYTSGATIAFNGIEFNVSGAPVAGDTFSVTQQNNQSVFKALQDAINVLKTPGTANLSSGIASALGNIDQITNNVLTVRGSVGSRMSEIDALDASGSDRDLQYAQTLSKLQDLDYAKAISDFTFQQTTLEAAQKSFMAVSGLSLFRLL